MVQAMIQISKDANQIVNVVKAKYALKDKSQAIERIVLDYANALLEPSFRPSFVEHMSKKQKEKTVRIKDFEKHFGI